jgi:omega-6 fatty acid desaturase (delta-12 desaturase)
VPHSLSAPPPAQTIEPAPAPREPEAPSIDAEAKRWMKVLSAYCDPDPKRSIFEFAVSIVPFTLLWVAQLICVQRGMWWGMVLTIPTAMFLVRLFMIQHDCGHGSYFRSKRANNALGRFIGVLTLTPYDYWRLTHAEHHASTSNLDRRGMGDVDTLTVDEYRALPRGKRLAYRFKRHPLVMLGLGPIYVFVLRHRLPLGLIKRGEAPWLSTMLTNLAIAGLIVGVGESVGYGTLLTVQVPLTLMSAAMGIWLFYVQHQFETTYWAHDEEWSFYAGSLLGSSHYELPPILRWFTANIGVHHVHHLVSRIPCYRLGDTVKDHPELRAMSRLTLRQSVGCFRLALWDEAKQRLVSFRDVHRSPA